MKYSIYVDLGYREATDLTIVNHTEDRHKVIFRSIAPNTELDDIIYQIVEWMDEFGITCESVYVPKFPAVEEKIRNFRPPKNYQNPRLEIL